MWLEVIMHGHISHFSQVESSQSNAACITNKSPRIKADPHTWNAFVQVAADV
jgi:hypothetical protein